MPIRRGGGKLAEIMDLRKKNLLLGLLVGAIAFGFFAGSIWLALHPQ